MALRRVLFALFVTACLTAGCDRDDGPTPRTIPDCTPQCEGRECGPDYCGATCGVCDDGLTCDAEGQCVCVSSCEGLACGDDGCGGSCGECDDGLVCSDDGQCACEPQCGESVCGDDGCGGSCGDCEDGLTCSGGDCISCVASCEGLLCGDDGCGGSCGGCDPGTICDAGACVACTPTCGDDVCGDDGCGGSCGECVAGEACEDGACVSSDKSAVVSSAVVASAIDDCCHDYNGDEAIDNKAGLLMPTIEFGVPQLLPATGLNGLIADAIGGGDFTLGITLVGLDDVANDESVDVRFFDAYVDGDEPSFDGQDALTVMPRSLDDGGAFKSVLPGAIEGGVLTAGPGTITLTIVVGTTVHLIPLDDVRLTATITSDGDGVSLTDGEFAGLFHRIDLYEVLNAFTAGECACYDIAPDPMITYEEAGANPVCHELLDGSKCETELCKILGGTCTIALGALGADIDTDDDGEPDSMSIGVLFGAAGASVAGVGDDVVPDGCQGGCGLGADGDTSTLAQLLALTLMITFALSRRRRPVDGDTLA